MDPPNENKDKQSSVLMDIIDIEDVAPIELPKKANDINWKVLKNFQTALKCFDSTEQAEKAIQHVFNSLPSTETETENTSIARTVPVAADVLLRMMSDAELWASSLVHIVHLLSSSVPPNLYRQMKSDRRIKEILMINADFQLPSPLVQRQNFHFYRFIKEVDENTWIMFDISTDYFLDSSDGSVGQKVWRRRSGVIVQKSNDSSKDCRVHWVENVQSPGTNLQDNHSAVINSKGWFSANRWLSTLIWSLRRSQSSFTINKMNVNAQNLLLTLTVKMKMVFLDIVSVTPDDRNWVTLSNDNNVRVMRSRYDTVSIPGTYSYIAVTTFQLKTTPSKAYNFLMQHLVEIQWPWPMTPLEAKSFKEREEMIKYESESNHITVLKRSGPNEDEYLLQEASMDGLFSYVIAAPMTEREIHSSLLRGIEGDGILHPAGFSILPENPNSESSLVTFAVRQPVNVSKTENDAVEPMEIVIGCMIQDIQELLQSTETDDSE
ncbi:homeobox-leucine zipper protein ROC7 [Daucus carota subsp. sativus]|uniref:homeobox-leucine zipper protein ROC7 n=1 Tax=Daucus carota subsp. sativus TaxID=79200 RepID=UPI0007EFC7EE|nr:PREDICTED: homeobox-leucine zipper protein ROC7-like [Daucus carota subsp. sativus]